MTEPQQPKNPPPEGAPVDVNPTGNTPNGIPEGIEGLEPMGRPNSDRAKTETSPLK